MQRQVFSRLGAKREQILVGPGFGHDNSIVRIAKGRVLVSTTDPISLIPSLGPVESAWLSVHLIASDLAASAIAPQYAMFDFNLPPDLPASMFTRFWDSMDLECKSLGVSVIGGHTGRYEGCNYSIIGGGSMFAIGRDHQYLTPAMARNGDDLILTKGAAIETTAVLARSFPNKVKGVIGSRLFDKAKRYLRKVSTVRDAMAAASTGIRARGVTAMHDATEGGVIAALFEVATASRLGLRVYGDNIPISDETLEICRLFHIDPLVSLSEGTLIITARPFATKRIRNRLSNQGIPTSVIGKMVSPKLGMRMSANGTDSSIRYPLRDPYWQGYSRALAKGWK
jgi:hydrogenase expression/formation protein HypE